MVCFLQLAHQDWVFALAWLDDNFLVSGSRDTTLALWRVPDPTDCQLEASRVGSSIHRNRSTSLTGTSGTSNVDLSMPVPSYSYINAVASKECRSAQKVRDIVFNRRLQELACVSLNGYIHIWSADRFVQVCTN